MRTIIYYFSATGNSLTVSRQIAARLGDTQLVRISPDTRPHPASADERIGLVFPVIMFGLPLIVRRFIERFEGQSHAYIFAVATCGGMPFATLKEASRLFAERGMTLSAGFGVPMVNSCTSVGQAPHPDRQARKLARAERAVDRICTRISANACHIEGGSPLLNWYFSGSLRRKAMAFMPTAASYFAADKNCTGCGVCAQVCPMRNIGMRDGRPQWQMRCEQCYGCLQWCPEEAIQVRGKKTEGRRRYRNPGVTLDDIVGSIAAPIESRPAVDARRTAPVETSAALVN